MKSGTMAGKRGATRATGQVRIIAGRWRGRRLPVAAASGLRPTPDRVRETLFNWLQPRIAGAVCLDLFAGTGALGFEAASRGAATVTLVEREVRAVTALRQVIAMLGVANTTVVRADALQYLARPAVSYDLIFIDPPFATDLLNRAVARLARGAWLKAEARVYLEAQAGRAPLALPIGWTIERQGRAGEVAYCLVRVAAGEPGPACSPGPCWP